MSRFLYPESCTNATSCGETDFYGNAMECCSNIEGGFCAGVPSTGISRCEKVAEMIQWDAEAEAEDEEEFEDIAEQEYREFSSTCYSSSEEERYVCLSCASTCPEGSRRAYKGLNSNKITISKRLRNLSITDSI